MVIHDKMGIYFLLCKPTKKMYIGSSKNIGRRLVHHLYELRKGIHNNSSLQEDYKIYGEGAFTKDGIEYCSESDLEVREDYWVNYYEALDSAKGYNKMKPDRSKVVTTNPEKVPVITIALVNGDITRYESILLCTRTLSMNQNRVKKALRYWDNRIPIVEKQGNEYKLTVMHSYKGYIFLYEDQYDLHFDYLNYQRERKVRIKKTVVVKEKMAMTGRRLGRKEIVAINILTNEEQVYCSMTEMCAVLGLRANKVSMVLADQRKSHRGYIFRYTGKTDRISVIAE